MRDTKLIFILTTGNRIMTSRLQIEKFVELDCQVQRKYLFELLFSMLLSS